MDKKSKCVGSEQIDAVDAVGCAGLGGGNLAEELVAGCDRVEE